MSVRPDNQDVSLSLPEHTLTQLDELVRQGRFTDYQTAVAVAVERLYAEEHHPTTRQQAFVRLCGALQLGTTPESLHAAKLDRLDWESGQQ